LVAADGLYAELYRTQFAAADSPTPFVTADSEPVVLVEHEDLRTDGAAELTG
jgi:ATP-binding cassette subfamily B protein